MRCALSIGLLLISLLPTAAESAPARLPRVQLYGADYVRLDAWAGAHGYQSAWLVPRKELRLSKSSGALLFTVDSRRMTLRGVTVWLSHAIAFKDGQAYVGALDLATAIQPVLSPTKGPANRKVRTIVIDPGHGGRDPGNQEGRRREKEFTLLLAREVRELLAGAGFKASLTREKDTALELPSRPVVANRRKADLFVSLHFNSADGPGGAAVKGAEVYCLTPVRASSTNARGEGAGAGAHPGNRFDSRNMSLAYQMQKALVDGAGMEDRGVKRARFAVLRDASMPAVLIEAGFMTNPADARKIYDPVQRRRLARAIVDGILNYKRSVE